MKRNIKLVCAALLVALPAMNACKETNDSDSELLAALGALSSQTSCVTFPQHSIYDAGGSRPTAVTCSGNNETLSLSCVMDEDESVKIEFTFSNIAGAGRSLFMGFLGFELFKLGEVRVPLRPGFRGSKMSVDEGGDDAYSFTYSLDAELRQESVRVDTGDEVFDVNLEATYDQNGYVSAYGSESPAIVYSYEGQSNIPATMVVGDNTYKFKDRIISEMIDSDGDSQKVTHSGEIELCGR